ncbi:hypothetical protein LA080_007937 [Diaporthe eres]|nr:hypothetical protein LA080_007937 [Diaporthe eres]
MPHIHSSTDHIHQRRLCDFHNHHHHHRSGMVSTPDTSFSGSECYQKSDVKGKEHSLPSPQLTDTDAAHTDEADNTSDNEPTHAHTPTDKANKQAYQAI